MSKMTKQAVQQLRDDLNELLANHDLGFEFNVGNIRYSETEATIKLVAKVIGAKSETETLNCQIKRIITDHGDLLRIFINTFGNSIRVYKHDFDPVMTKKLKTLTTNPHGSLIATYDYPKYSLNTVFRIFSIDQEPYDYE